MKNAKMSGNRWPRKVQPGSTIVTVYKRKTPKFKRKDGSKGGGNDTYAILIPTDDRYAQGTNKGKRIRRWDTYRTEAEALAAAEALAKRRDELGNRANSITPDQALEYASAAKALAEYGVSVSEASQAVAGCFKSLTAGGKSATIPALHTAIEFYLHKHKPVKRMPLASVLTEFLGSKGDASDRYGEDLKCRLERFAGDFKRDCCDITSGDILAWLHGQKKLGAQSKTNYRRVIHTFFEFAVSMKYADENPVTKAKIGKAKDRDVKIYSPDELSRLLAAASPDILPSIAIGALAGLRSAEIQRLDWKEHIHFSEKEIVLDKSITKGASRRVVPICDNLIAWLAPYANQEGKVWRGDYYPFYAAQKATAAATAVEPDLEKGIKGQKAIKWKANALRHSYASYRLAQIGDAGRVAGEMGNSARIIHEHYKALVRPAQATQWFSIMPQTPANVLGINS